MRKEYTVAGNIHDGDDSVFVVYSRHTTMAALHPRLLEMSQQRVLSETFLDQGSSMPYICPHLATCVSSIVAGAPADNGMVDDSEVA